jgi:hypothetical protein
MRVWFSGPRLLNGLVRPGISLGREDFRPARLPSYRRYELRKGLQEAAKGRGEPITKDDADYAIDKALACGSLDSSGALTFKVKGNSRDECVAQVLETAAAWNTPVTRAEAKRHVDAGIAAGTWPRRVGRYLLSPRPLILLFKIIASAILSLIIIACFWLIATIVAAPP